MKHALVSGGTSNLGSAVVRLLVAHDYEVTLCYAHHAPKEMEHVHPVCVDLENPSSLSALDSLSPLDLLVNNSGIFISASEKDIPLASWDKVFSVNIRGMHLMVSHLLHLLREGSSIVNVASINAFHPGFGGTVSYDASKGAVVSYTRSLASELAPSVRVNAVAPGLLDAPYLHTPGNTVREAFEKRALLHRMVDVGEVASAVLFLAENAGMTGQVVTVDCGYLEG
jgi:NAD(P)-dependent dehydrogenase (short-subunit alcohol dehydrogenase family)